MTSERSIRLAGYASTALATVCHADITIYDGPPIPIGLDSVLLELDGLEIELSFFDRVLTGSRQTSWWTCCSWTGGPDCNWSDIAIQNVYYGSRFLSAVGLAGVSTVDFLPVGRAPGGLEAPIDSTLDCNFTSLDLAICGGVSSQVLGNCGESRTMYLGFTAPMDDVVVTGWIEIERSASGGHAITRWAYEDDGSPILTGQAPETACTGDLDGNGMVDSADLGSLLAAWGDCTGKGGCPADIDGSTRVDAADLGLMIAAWGPCPDDPCAGVDCFSEDPCLLAACIEGICYTDDLRTGACDPGGCCVANGTPGCIDDACMEVVCMTAPDCCDVAWDTTCATIAMVFGCDCP